VTIHDLTTYLFATDVIEITLPTTWSFNSSTSTCEVTHLIEYVNSASYIPRVVNGAGSSVVSGSDDEVMTVTLNDFIHHLDFADTVIVCTDVTTPDDAIVADTGIFLRTMDATGIVLDHTSEGELSAIAALAVLTGVSTEFA